MNKRSGLFWWIAMGFVGWGLWSCGSPSTAPSSQAQEAARTPTGLFFGYPTDGKFTTENFYNFPFPHTLRIKENGTPDLTFFPAPKRVQKCPLPPSKDAFVGQLIGAYEPDDFLRNLVKQANNGAVGAGNNPTLYLRFNRPLAARSLPPVEATLHDTSPAFLVNIEPNSPRLGQRLPIRAYPQLRTRFAPDFLAAFRPEPGFSLAPNEHYALVLTRSIRDEEGWPLAPMPLLDTLNAQTAPTTPHLKALWDAYQPFWAFLKSKTSLKPEDIAAVSVFRGGDPLQEQRKIVQFLREKLPAPTPPKDITCTDPGASRAYLLCKGTYTSPNFQFGDPPYLDEKTGFFSYEKDGTPIYKMEELRFALAWPKSAFEDGALRERPLPIVLYAHGTGGDYQSFISDNTAERLARMGIVSLGIDQVMHGNRGRKLGSVDLDFLFFNALNLPAARDNVRQSALDYHWLVRLMQTFTLAHDGHNLRIDPKRIWFMGHSQGGLIGPLFLAFEHKVPAAFLSAPGALLVGMLLSKNEPKDPIEIPAVISYLVCDGDAAKTPFHPVFSVLQSLLDPADPVNYGPLILAEDRPPMQFFMTKGNTDNYAPPAVFDPLAVAMKLPMFGPSQDNLIGLTLRGVPTYPLPVSGNLTHPSGTPITAGFTQHQECKYSSGGLCDGHFVAFHNPDALRNWQSFFRSLTNRTTAEVH
ncbi:hypothetical protein L6R29_02455 [Myxococcota bacterium]|nr:hypothetical protein [Myxococcota bacterium]